MSDKIYRLIKKRERIVSDLKYINDEIKLIVEPRAKEFIGYWHVLVREFYLTKKYPGNFFYEECGNEFVYFKSYSFHMQYPISMVMSSNWKSLLKKDLKEKTQAKFWRLLNQ